MLYSFGQVCATMLHQHMHACSIFNTQQCCNMLPQNVAIVSPELANTGPTMLGCCIEMLQSFGRDLKRCSAILYLFIPKCIAWYVNSKLNFARSHLAYLPG